jgi:hypothetical protein
MEERRSFIEEKAAFRLIDSKLKDNKVFQRPMGSDSGFPDFGFEWNGIDVHVEFKAKWNAMMSGLSSWYYKNNTFGTNKTDDEARQIIRLMQRDSSLKKNAADIGNIILDLKGLKRGLVLSSTSLGAKKASLVDSFDKKVQGKKVLGKLESDLLATTIINIYKNKFNKNKRLGKKSVCLMMIANEVWMLDNDGCSEEDLKALAIALNPKSTKMNRFAIRACRLEVRISPRSNGNIDTRASLKLKSKGSISFKGLTVS